MKHNFRRSEILIFTIIFCCLVLISCSSNQDKVILFPESNFNCELNGKELKLFTLKNINGITAQITNFGGRVISLWVPDKEKHFDDIVLGYENLDGYLNSKEKYYGAIIGRYANRIANGKFEIDVKEYILSKRGKNHGHGGIKGFSDVVWNAHQIDDQTLELTHESPHLDEGYPGNLSVTVVYTLTSKNELKIEYWAVTDKPTIVNFTHHSFFNLRGSANGNIYDHILQINANNYTQVTNGPLPTGVIASVEGTPLDFLKPIKIGKMIDEDFDQFKLA